MREPTMPHDANAERVVLGGVLLENEAWHAVSELHPSDFYVDRHAEVFKAMRMIERAGMPIDTTTLRNQLATSGKLDAAGGDEFLLALTDTIPTVSNIEAHARIVHDLATAREVRRTALRIAEEAGGAIEDMSDFLDRASTILGRVVDRRSRVKSQFVRLGDATFDEFEILRARKDRGETAIGHLTGFHRLDDQLGGFAPGDLIVVGARPGMGKTAFVNECKLGIARTSGRRVLSFELEMTRQQLVHRVWAAHAEINLRRIRAAALAESDFAAIAEASEELGKLGIDFVFQRSLKVDELSRAASRYQREHGDIGLIVVDYLQRVQPSRRMGSRDEEVGEVAKGLKTLAGEFNCPVVAVSSLNRSVEKEQDKRPKIADMRASGEIEFEADTILLLYRDEVYNPNTPKQGIAELNIGKQRSGENNVVVELKFTKEFTRFENIDAYQQRSFHHG